MAESAPLLGSERAASYAHLEYEPPKPSTKLSRRVLREMATIIVLSGPLIVTQVLRFTLLVVSLAFCGQLGKDELDAASLATSFVSVTAITVGTGMTGACDTLLTQCYGSQNKRRVGIIAQRALLVLTITCLIVWAIHLNTENLLLVIGQEHEVARLAGEYVDWYMASVWFYFIYSVLFSFLQSQNIMMPMVIISVVVNVLNAVFHYVAVIVLEMSVKGAAISVALSYFLLSAFTVLYVWFRRDRFVLTWPGWSRHCLQEWGEFIKLAIPAMLMQCIEMWSFEVGTFLTGVVGLVELGAQSIVFQLSSTCFYLALGIAVASSIRIGQFLGANDWESARFCSRVSFLVAMSGGLLIGLLQVAFREYIPEIYTQDKEIQVMATDVIPIIAAVQFVDYTVAVGSGVLRGCGRQAYGVIFNIIGYYFMGLPVGIPLLFLTPLKVQGLWIGMVICIAAQSLMFFAFIWRTNWQRQAEVAQLRAGVIPGEAKKNPDESVQSVDKYTVHELPTSVALRRRLVAVFVGLVIFGTGLVLRVTLQPPRVSSFDNSTLWSSEMPSLLSTEM